MGQNIIEIILDTSESMGEQIFSSWKITKFDLAKEILLNLFTEWEKSKCKHSLYVRAIQDAKLVTLNAISEISAVTLNEKEPLSKVLEDSITQLSNLDQSYQNRVIVVLTDGKNRYNIETKIDSKIKIYTMEIGGVEGLQNQTLQSLSRETNALNYSVLIENNGDKDIEKMQSHIKRYFKCVKIPIWGLLSLLLIVSLYFVMPLFFKSCQNMPFPPIRGCSSSSDSQVQIKNFVEKKSTLSSCEKRTVNGIELHRCHLNSQKSVEAIIYAYGTSKVIVLKNFASGTSDITENRKKFLKELFDRLNIKEPNTIKEIQIFGHTDLEQVDKKKYHYFNRNCEALYHVNKNTNECLGNERAFQVKKIISKTDYGLLELLAQYDDDFFMAKVNNRLGGTLWIVLDLEEEISLLMEKLDIQEFYDVRSIRENREIQQKIQAKHTWYEKKFKEFRDVVIVIEE